VSRFKAKLEPVPRGGLFVLVPAKAAEHDPVQRAPHAGAVRELGLQQARE
jgi:hypothetical protein